jgi:hypothetical protein
MANTLAGVEPTLELPHPIWLVVKARTTLTDCSTSNDLRARLYLIQRAFHLATVQHGNIKACSQTPSMFSWFFLNSIIDKVYSQVPMNESKDQHRPTKADVPAAGGARDATRLKPQVCFFILFTLQSTLLTLWTANEGQHRLMPANTGQHKPPKTNASQHRPAQANEDQRQPANTGQQTSCSGRGGSRRVTSRALGIFFVSFTLWGGSRRVASRASSMFFYFIYFTVYVMDGQ